MKKHHIFTALSIALITSGLQAQNLTPIQSQIIGKPTFSISNNRTTGETQVQVMPTPGIVLSTTNASPNTAAIQTAPGNVTELPSNLEEEGPPPSQAAIRGMNTSPVAVQPTPAPSMGGVNLNPMVSPNSPVTPINPVNPSVRVETQSKPVGQEPPKTSHVYGDISSWNKTTIEEHEKQGQKMAEEEYMKFLMK